MIVADIGSGIPRKKLTGQMLDVANSGLYVAVDRMAECRSHIISDACQLPFSDMSVDVVICRALLEHLPDPWLAVSEIYRILKLNGQCYVVAPFITGYHGNKHYNDFYRFTREGIKRLFSIFPQIEITPMSGYIETLFWLSPLAKSPTRLRNVQLTFIRFIDRFLPKSLTRNWYVVVQKV